MERKNTLLEIGNIRLFAKFTYFYFYFVLIIALKENVTINLNQFCFQIRMRVNNLFQGIHQTIWIYSFEAIDKRNIILSGIRILFPFQINTSLVFHQRVRSTSFKDWQRTIRSLRKHRSYSSDRGEFHDLCHLDIDSEMALEKCTQTHGCQR